MRIWIQKQAEPETLGGFGVTGWKGGIIIGVLCAIGGAIGVVVGVGLWVLF